MINYTSCSQLSIDLFKTPFETSLLSDNRWVLLSAIVPWDHFAGMYMKIMNLGHGRPGINPRIVLGALIIKHLEGLDDRGVISAIQENVYMQFFVGLKEFSPAPVFDPSLFVQIRKRVGNDVFDSMNAELIKSFKEPKSTYVEENNDNNDQENNDLPNKGKLQLDATVADQYITYPTDTGLLNTSRKKCEQMIDDLYAQNGKKGVKPRTYRKKLDKVFMSYSKKKKKSKTQHRKMQRQLLEAVNRNLGHINKLLDLFEERGEKFPLKHPQQITLMVINTIYQQQKKMYDQNSHSHSDRIVSVFQPHVRPIPRGKSNAQIEFGAKLGVSLDEGFARINTFSWNPYNESNDLIKQVKAYYLLHGYYPELVQVDKIYATRENRIWLKERNIRITAPPLGRKPEKIIETNYQKKKRKREASERNHIEGKFGQGKNAYKLNQIRAKLKETSESWISAIFFIMNLLNYKQKSLFCACFTLTSKLYKAVQKMLNVIIQSMKIIQPLSKEKLQLN